MQDWGAPTGSLHVVRELLGLRSFPPQTVSVRAARCFVQECLVRTSLHQLADDAELLVCELAANAVLHARTDFDVAVSELSERSGVRVTVRDDAPALPVVTAPSATAMSGRGLALVKTLASRWGAGPSSSARKGVWFELDLVPERDVLQVAAPHGAGGGGSPGGEPDCSVEELLAAWSDSEPDPDIASPSALGNHHGPDDAPGGQREPVDEDVCDQVVLPALDAADLLAAKEGMDDLLRELQLLLLDGRQQHTAREGADLRTGHHLSADNVELARRLDAAARTFDPIRRQVRQQVSLAVAGGDRTVQLRLTLPPGTRAAALQYMAAVEAAEDLAERGVLLGDGARVLRRHRAVRRAYLGEVVAAARS